MSCGDINDTAVIPKGGFVLESDKTGHTSLPNYQSQGISESRPITLVDSHRSLIRTIRKARLIVFEIGRKRIAIHKRMAKKIRLIGSIRDLDEKLANLMNDLESRLELESVRELGRMGYSEIMVGGLLLEDTDFQDCTSTLQFYLRSSEQD